VDISTRPAKVAGILDATLQILIIRAGISRYGLKPRTNQLSHQPYGPQESLVRDMVSPMLSRRRLSRNAGSG
jgi:hypothetical protein